MKFRVTQKILAGYVAGFVLLLAFAGLTLFNGKKIEATTVALSQEKIPGLIAVSELKYELQSQTNHLYELYATNDQALFDTRHKANMDAAAMQFKALEKLPEFKVYQGNIAALNEQQKQLTDQFVSVMRQPEVDWDKARSVLSEFSKSSEAIGNELDF